MIEQLKNLKNLPLIIILIIVTVIAIVLSIVKAQKTEETNANTIISETTKEENNEDEKDSDEPIITTINVQEVEDETEEEATSQETTDAQYFIRVNYGQNVVTIYTKNSKGEYSIPYKAMVCSTGSATPKSGTYTIPSGQYSRGTWGMMIGNVWAQYYTRIKGSILFHSVPYTAQNKWSLEYWEYDKLGTTASAGCIRLTVQDARWIYNNCPAGTNVEFYTDSNPGPLGKPEAQKISEDEAVRGWDPTDPDATNPWKTYTPIQEEEIEKEETTTTPSTNTKPVTPSKPVEPQEPSNPSQDEETTTPSQGEETTTPNEGEGTGEETTNPEGEKPGEETTEPGEEENVEETTPNEGEVTTPPSEGEVTTPPSEGESNGGETTTPSEGESEENKPTTPEEGKGEETTNPGGEGSAEEPANTSVEDEVVDNA